MNTGIARSVTTVEGTEQAFEALNQVVPRSSRSMITSARWRPPPSSRVP